MEVDARPRGATAALPVRHGLPTPVRNAVPTTPRLAERVRTDPLFTAITVVLDIASAACAVLLAQWSISGAVDERNVAALSWFFVPIVVGVLALQSMYRRRLDHNFLDDLTPVLMSVAVSTLAMLTIMLLVVPPFEPGDVVVPYVRQSELALRIWGCAAVLMPVVRLLRSFGQRYLRRKFRAAAPALLIGSGPIVHQLVARMRQIPEYGLRPAGILDDTQPADVALLDIPYLGTTDDLESATRATRAEELIIAPTLVSDEELARTAQLAHNLGMRVRVVPRVMDAVGDRAWVEHIGGVPLLVLYRVDPKGWQFALKHVFDRFAAALALAVLSPVLLTLALLVKRGSPGPVLYRQERIGRDGKVFNCLKFRSMGPAGPDIRVFEPEAGSAPGGVEGVDRRTRVGRFMRKTSLDELPQFFNVLRGEMSLVGPRPERPEFVDLFEMQIRRYGERHRVKAGITGWAQVHGLRGQTSIADRAEFDNYYIENWSLRLDMKILAMTVLAVFRSAED